MITRTVRLPLTVRMLRMHYLSLLNAKRVKRCSYNSNFFNGFSLLIFGKSLDTGIKKEKKWHYLVKYFLFLLTCAIIIFILIKNS